MSYSDLLRQQQPQTPLAKKMLELGEDVIAENTLRVEDIQVYTTHCQQCQQPRTEQQKQDCQQCNKYKQKQ